VTGVEVDTIRLRGRVKDADSIERMAHLRSSRLYDDKGEGRMVLTAGTDTLRSGARCGVDIANQGAPEAWVEFSAPKVGTGSNVVALPLAAALDVARDVYDEAGDVVDWVTPFDQLRVQRLDLDRDFEDVQQQGPLLSALAKVRAPYNPKTRLYPDSERNGAVTLTRGPAARWLATLYSKEGEAAHRARYASTEDRPRALADLARAAGRLRYELRLRPDVMGPDLRLVRDVQGKGEDLAGLARRYFDRVGYGLEVTGMERAAALVMGADHLRVDARLALLGWLFCEAQQVPVDVYRKNAKRYRDRATDLGVTAPDLLDLATTNVRLDYDTARMVAA
jgi:hypothetical protein